MTRSTDDAVSFLQPDDVHDLRRRVLRGGDDDADVTYPTDRAAGAFHLGRRAGDGRPIAIASFAPVPFPVWARRWWPDLAPGDNDELGATWQLRGMAVEPGVRNRGLATLLLDAAQSEILGRRGSLLWCNARDTALGFYRTRGWDVRGEGFTTEIGVAHHVAVCPLR